MIMFLKALAQAGQNASNAAASAQGQGAPPVAFPQMGAGSPQIDINPLLMMLKNKQRQGTM